MTETKYRMIIIFLAVLICLQISLIAMLYGRVIRRLIEVGNSSLLCSVLGHSQSSTINESSVG